MRSERGLDRLVRVLMTGSAAGVLAVAGCGGPGGGPAGPACGDGTVNATEQCDDGNTATGDGCDASCTWEIVPLTAFRMSTLELRDPHVFQSVVGCEDLTDMPSAALGFPSINQAISDDITMDGTDADMFLDLSFLLIFRGPAQPGASGRMDVGLGDCLTSTSCDPSATAPPAQTTTYASMANGTCMAAYPGTTTTLDPPYMPSITNSTSPCWVSAPLTFTMDVAGNAVVLNDAQVAATWMGNPATSLVNGLVRGFLSEADAAATMIMGFPLTNFLAPGTGACNAHDDRDTGLDGTTMGWWFYMNFTADRLTTYTGT